MKYGAVWVILLGLALVMTAGIPLVQAQLVRYEPIAGPSSASAGEGDDDDDDGPCGPGASDSAPHELLSGRFICSNETAWEPDAQHVSLIVENSTSGLTDREFAIYRVYPLQGDPVTAAESCIAELQELGYSVGCIMAPIDDTSIHTVVRRESQFVCHGLRNEMVDVLASLSRAVLTGNP